MAQSSLASSTIRPKKQFYRDHLKRPLDVVLVLLSAPAFLLILSILALLIALDGGQPFYRQDRLGRGGRAYKMWKLRTMCPDAESVLSAHLAADPAAYAEWKISQKLKADPRVTPIGRILRKTSLDELPQLWNVLKGDMSLVGPRPMMVDQQDLYPGRAYYAMRPGITGPWQVSERNRSSFADRVRFDNSYFEVLSFRTDVKLLFSTIGVVLKGTGC